MRKSRAYSPPLENIETVARLEERFLQERTTVERIGDAIGSFAGSMTFVVLHILAFALWFAVNAKLIPGLPAFDPYPYILLSMAVSVEAVILSTFVLMKQNRESKRAENRQHLTLQIDLLTEQEATRTLQLVQRICQQLGIDDVEKDAEAKVLSETTAVDQLAEELKNKLPPAC